MVNNTQFQSYNSTVASNYNVNVASTTLTTLASWNANLSAATQIIKNVSNGTVRSTFVSPDTTVITVNTSGGSLTLSGVSLSGDIVTLTTMMVTSANGSQKTTVNGSIYFDINTNEFSGTYSNIFFQGGLTGATPYSYNFIGEMSESNNNIKGLINSYESTSFNSTTNVTTTSTYNLSNALFGLDYVNDTYILSGSTLVTGYSATGRNQSGTVVYQSTYDSFSPVSANVLNIFVPLMAGDDTIIASGDGDRIISTGYAGNDYITGDSGDNYINNRVEISKLIYSGLGNDSIDGAGGHDTIFMGSNKSINAYSFQNYDSNNNSFIIVDNSSIDNTGIDFLKNIEEIQFSDINLSTFDFKYYLNLIPTSKLNIGVLQYGSLGSSIFSGSSKNDFIFGNAGNDTINSGSGDDCVSGGVGSDFINGGDGVDTAIYSGRISDYFISYNRALSSVSITDKRSGGDGVDILKSVEKLQFADKTFDLNNPSFTSTPTYGKTPSFLFDSAYYLLKNPDLIPTISISTAFDHYIKYGAAEGKSPNKWFDPIYYANKWSDLKPLNLDAATLFMHYNLYGVWEGRSAGSTFDKYDGNRYLKDNPDVAAYVDANVKDFLGSRVNGAIAHYIIYGANESRTGYDSNGQAIDQVILIGTPT